MLLVNFYESGPHISVSHFLKRFGVCTKTPKRFGRNAETFFGEGSVSLKDRQGERTDIRKIIEWNDGNTLQNTPSLTRRGITDSKIIKKKE